VCQKRHILFCDVARNLVSFLLLFVVWLMACFCLIIGLEKFTSFIYGDFPLNISYGSIFEKLRHGKPVHCLETDGGAPSVSSFRFLRFPHLCVFLKIYITIFL